MKFINRSRELNLVQEIIEHSSSKTSICFSTCNATGFTSFCKKIEYAYDQKEIFPVYINGEDKSGYTVYSSTFEKLWEKDKQLFNKYLSLFSITEPGSIARNTAAALAGIPFMGNFLGEPFKQVSDSARFLRQNVHLQESFFKLITSLAQKRLVVFLIDNLQLLDSWSISLLENIEDSELNVNYVFGQCVSKGHEADASLLVKLSSRGRRIVHKTFDPPDINFIKEIANHTGNPITNSFAQELIYESEGNLYKILARLKNIKPEDEKPNSSIQISILKLLFICSQPIRKSDILTLVSSSPDHSLVTEHSINQDIEILRSTGNIFETALPDGDTLLKLKSSSVAEALLQEDSLGNQLFLTNHIYEFYQNAWQYSLRHSKSELVLMLYRIAKKVAPDAVKRHALNIIKISFALGTSERAKEFINEAVNVDNPSNETEFYLCVTYNIAYRKYGVALDLITSPMYQNFTNSNYYEIARAICLERSRKYDEFALVLDKLLPVSSIHEEGILRVHQINALVHSNKLLEARDLLVYSEDKLKKAFAFPYILRTATSIFEPEQSELYLKKALKKFEANGDDFGFATSLANMGILQIEKGNYSKAIRILKESRAVLMIYGIHHVYIIENSLGLAKLYSGAYDMAIQHFNKGLALSSGEMSQLYFHINLSIADCLKGNFQAAIDRLNPFEDFVANYPVDRVRQKYYLNMTCMAIIAKADHLKVKRWSTLMFKYPDRKKPQRTEQLSLKYGDLLNAIDKKIDLSYFSPCYLEYWYSNPLADLTTESLPNEALI